VVVPWAAEAGALEEAADETGAEAGEAVDRLLQPAMARQLAAVMTQASVRSRTTEKR
jgi:hypothetical protein